MQTQIRTEAEHSDRTAVARLRYRPYLDGLRAVAVYLVVAFHARLSAFSGGFIGVDIFFVLSGFLVTKILLQDLSSVGRIRGFQFYARRARRILPAAAVTLVVTAFIYGIVATPAEMLDALGGFRAAFLYVANWYFIGQSADYFAAAVETNPTLTFWSLAVEEQFYLLWPLLLGGLYLASSRARRWRWWSMRIVVATAAAASAVAALLVSRTDVARAYYGTDTRAYQLLAGAALALTPQLLCSRARWSRVARVIAMLALAGLVALATSALVMGPIRRGLFVTVLALLAIAALENSRGGLTQAALSARPFTYLGRISYGVYLWHWPVIVIIDHERDLSPLSMFAVACLLATALAAISFRVLEQPIRASATLDRYKSAVVATGLASSVAFGVIVMPAILDPDDGEVDAALNSESSSPQGELLDWREAKEDIVDLPNCLDRPVEACTVSTGSGRRVLLMGDSLAHSWIPAFTELARQRSWTFSVAAYPTCPWQKNLQVLTNTLDKCKASQADWYSRVVPELDPDLIILTHRTYDDAFRLPFVGADDRVVEPDSPDYEQFLRRTSLAALSELSRDGREIVIIEPIPPSPSGEDPLSCLSEGNPAEKCSYEAQRTPTPLELFYRTEARAPNITSVDLDRVVCPSWPTCDAIVGRMITRRDGAHMTVTYARSLASQVGAQIPE